MKTKSEAKLLLLEANEIIGHIKTNRAEKWQIDLSNYFVKESEEDSFSEIKDLINQFKEEELGNIQPYSSEAEISAGFETFIAWLNCK